MGFLQAKRDCAVTQEALDRAMMRNRYLADAPPTGALGDNQARMVYFRTRLREVLTAQEAPNGDTEDARARVETLFDLART